MKTVLFQGDSITDAGRSRTNDAEMGYGYPTLVTAELSAEYPEQFEFINKGISGNRVVDLYARIKSDFINIKPDYLTILIGVNDVWHEFQSRNGVDNDKYFEIYCKLIEEIKAMLPEVKIFILEPFVLKASATSDNYSVFRRETEMRAKSSKAVAEKYSLEFIPLQQMFDDAEKKAQASFWLADGVHPTAAGHRLIANKVSDALRKAF